MRFRFNKVPYWKSFHKILLFSFHYFYLVFCQAEKLINHLGNFFVGCGDLCSEGVAVGLVLVEVILPFVLLGESETDLLFLQLGQHGLEIGFIEMFQGSGDSLNAQVLLQTM